MLYLISFLVNKALFGAGLYSVYFLMLVSMNFTVCNAHGLLPLGRSQAQAGAFAALAALSCASFS